MARHPELEAAILADRDDPELYRVYGDWLEQQGDPRGELIALHLAKATTQANQHLRAHPTLVPPVTSAWGAHFDWSYGFITAAELDDPSAEDFATLILHPSCALLSSLKISISGDVAADVIGQLAKHVSPVVDLEIRHTVIGFEIRDRPPLGDEIWDHLPFLRSLSLMNPGLFATLRHPGLVNLSIAGDQPFRAADRWDAPALETLEWSDPDRHVGLLWRSNLPALRELRVSGAMMKVFKEQAFLTLVRRLEVLELPRPAIAGRNQAAVEMLIANADGLRHLRELVVSSGTRLPDAAISRVLPNLTWGDYGTSQRSRRALVSR